jgi:catechol 2,3-dioxygenase-like lactoylglutathione lyase family enzyme
MLLDGVNHVAVVTRDLPRLQAFYREVFDAEIGAVVDAGPGQRLGFIHIGSDTALNVFAPSGDDVQPDRSAMGARGAIDHMGLRAASKEAFDDIRGRLMARGAADDFVTDFGPHLSIFFRDPDGLECEVLVANPDAVPGVTNPPGTRAAGY